MPNISSKSLTLRARSETELTRSCRYELERSEGKLVHAQADSTEARSWVARLKDEVKSHTANYDSLQQR